MFRQAVHSRCIRELEEVSHHVSRFQMKPWQTHNVNAV